MRAILFRRDAKNSKVTRYQLVDLRQAAESVRMNPFDSLVVFPRELFSDAFEVEIRGAVRRPGVYRYDPSLGLKELFTLAGGFTLEASTDRVEVFRLLYGNNTTTETRIGNLVLNEEFQATGGDLTLSELKPFDIIAVRAVPDFEETQLVEIRGEVRYPGVYPLNDDIRRISDVVAAAGGLTQEAFPDGATLRRAQKNTGIVVLELGKIMANDRSPNNVVALGGDLVEVPKAQQLVTIRTLGTLANQAYTDSIISAGRVVLTFQGERAADWYIEEYAGGFAKRALKKTVTVREPSGRLRRTSSFLGIRNYPEVKAGSTVSMEIKPPKRVKPEREPAKWSEVAAAITTALTGGLTLILLLDRL